LLLHWGLLTGLSNCSLVHLLPRLHLLLRRGLSHEHALSLLLGLLLGLLLLLLLLLL
jgi:hypothetical protein